MPRHIIDLGIQSITGRIGINTSSPLYDFDVNGTGYFRSGLLVSGQISTSQRPVVNGTGVLLIGEVSATLPDTLVYTTGNQTISGIKTFSERMDVSGIKFRVLTGAELPPAYQEGLVWYNDDNKSLNYYNDISTAPVALAQEQIVRGTNNLGFQINKGQVVYITGGGGGDRFPAFQLSIASGEGGSARTIGVATSNILNNEKGYAVSFGRLEGIDTSTYNVGQTLYLSWEASGGFTGVKPQAPNHMVRVGTVIRQGNSANGVIFVNIQNGFELEELHNVRIINEQNKDAILWNSASGLWLNRQISTGDVGGIENFVRYDYINKPNSLTVRDNASDVDIFDYVVDDHFILRGLDGLSEVALSPSIGYAYISGVDKIVANASNPANLISGYSVAANSVSVSGNSVLTTESNAVFRTGDQSISGVKTFNDEIIATGMVTLSGSSAMLREAGTFGVRLVPNYGNSAWRVSRNDVPGDTYCYFGYHGGYRIGFWTSQFGTFGWTAGSATLDPDTYLSRDAAGIIAQINGVNPQTYRIYNTYSTTGSFERGKIGWNSNVFEVGTEQGSTGGLPRNLALVTSGQQRLTVDTIGRVGIGTTSPSERLNVNGNILVTSYIINASNLSGLDINAVGVNAGDLATGASYSNFIGSWAGYRATNASNSNFFGQQAGYQATSANDSFFAGYRAGYQASGTAYHSVFIGNQAGYQATNASNCNFIGQQAGYQASGMKQSNFFGQSAGYAATFAEFSNFFGSNAGNGATSAYYSNFFGTNAGRDATTAQNSNFLGRSAGQSAANANQSNFFGWNAGYQASGASNSNFFGYYAGYQATNALLSNFLGSNAGNGAINAPRSNFFGELAGNQALNAGESNFIGHQVGYQASGAAQSNFLGYQAGYQASGAYYSNFIGYRAGKAATYANNSIFIGRDAGLNDTINNSAGNKSSILIGNYTSTSGYSDSIAIGQGVANSAAQQLNIGNVLYATSINNGTTPSSTPVLGKVGVRVENPQYTLDVNGSGNFSSGIYVSGNSTFYSNLSISGHLSAVTKAFKINHPTKPGKMLVHGASEAPEWSVFVRGKTSEPIINLPDYWSGLVHEDSVTCTLTPIGKPMSLYVVEQTTERVIVGGLEAGGSYNYVVYGERKDVERLIPEV